MYIRHRQRMVQESVFEDLKNTLIACRWCAGTTTRQVVNPANNTLQTVTTAPTDVYPIISKGDVQLVDFFPDKAESPDINTFAVDPGFAGEATLGELGSNLKEQPYTFTFAFFAENDAVAHSLMGDLKDRYEGRLVANEAIALYDYLTDPTPVAAWLDIEYFRYTKDVQIRPDTTALYYGELVITDYVDDTE